MATKKKLIKPPTQPDSMLSAMGKSLLGLYDTSRNYLARRPHRSFRRTRRRDYSRTLKLPGYWAFTLYVRRTLQSNTRLFIMLALVYAILTGVMVGVASQDTYTALTDTLRQTGSDVFGGNFGELGKASLLFITATTGGLSQSLTEVQQVYAGLIALLTWMTTVWLLRNLLAGHKLRLRDGLYNASAPIVSTFIVALVLVVQLLPAALALIGYSAAQSTHLLDGGVAAMLFWLAAGSLGLLSLYWITSTLIALVVVTLPGMYPARALKIAGDLAIGRRIRILLRLLWMGLGIGVAWLVIMIPVIIFDTWLKAIWSAVQWLPIIPVTLLGLSSLTVVWSASYIYLLYRKVVDDDAEPA